MKQVFLFLIALGFSSQALADTLAEVELTVLKAEDTNQTDEIRIVVKSDQGDSDESQVTLSPGDSEIMYPNLYGRKFTIQVWEQDEGLNADDFFGTLRLQGVGTDSKTIRARQGVYEVRWTVTY